MLGIKKKLRKLTGRELVPEVSSLPRLQADCERTDNEISQKPSSQASAPALPHAKPYGLFPLSESEPLGDSKDSTGVDIVAIHGLNGNAYTTWQHENGNLWLRDLLPSDLPGSRVFTYGYPSELFFSNSVATLRDYSRQLLVYLKNVPGGRERPIIFICHSLGGIVCKQVSSLMILGPCNSDLSRGSCPGA